MNTYTVNFICKDHEGHNIVRSEEIDWVGVDEAVEIVKSEWCDCDVEIIWAGIRHTDGGL